jgi:hypothetical protein
VPAWTVAENLAPTGIPSPVLPTRSESWFSNDDNDDDDYYYYYDNHNNNSFSMNFFKLYGVGLS